MLNSSEILSRLARDLAVVDIDFRYKRGVIDDNDPRPEIAKYNPKQLRPVMVVLNSNGKKVFKQVGGFANMREGELFASYIVGKHYRSEEWKEYRKLHSNSATEN